MRANNQMENFFGISFWQSFFSNLGATIIGVGLGIPVALFINRWIEGRTEKEKKAKILKLIHEDLKSSYEMIGEWFIDPIDNNLNLLIIHPRFEMWNAFSEGGEIQWIKDPETLAYLAEAFACIRNVKELAISYHNMIFRPELEKVEGASEFYYSDVLYAVDYGLDMIGDALREVFKDDIPNRKEKDELDNMEF